MEFDLNDWNPTVSVILHGAGKNDVSNWEQVQSATGTQRSPTPRRQQGSCLGSRFSVNWWSRWPQPKQFLPFWWYYTGGATTGMKIYFKESSLSSTWTTQYQVIAKMERATTPTQIDYWLRFENDWGFLVSLRPQSYHNLPYLLFGYGQSI